MRADCPAPLVHVVDDDSAMRDSLSWLLESAGYRVALHRDAEAFLQGGAMEAGDCVLLDVRMPGLSGIAVHEVLIERRSTVPVIFVTGHGDVPMAVQAIKRGAADFIEKPFNDDKLLALIASAVRANRRCDAARAARLRVAARIATLSPREREVMDCVVAGKLNKLIADELGISIKTVEAHRGRVMQKLGVSSVAELVQAVVDTAPAGQ
jgi:FixJ family two-component response regulator